MKTKQLLITAAFVSATSLSAKKIEKSKIKEATVFFQGAVLTHTASSILDRGENEIYIEGLSPNIDKNSLKITTTNGVIVSASEFSVDFLSESQAANQITKKLNDSISIYEKKLEQIKAQNIVSVNLLSLLQKGTEKNVSGSDKGLDIEELKKTMDYYKNKSIELQKEQAVNAEQIKKYEKYLIDLKKQLNQETLKNAKSSGVLRLSLSSPLASNCNLLISYYTPAANWVPYYDINIESTDKPIKIIAKSKVRQTTGLDWNNVKLTLSSAMPSNGRVAPLFSTWFLESNKPMSYNRGSSASSSMRAAQNSFSYEFDAAAGKKQMLSSSTLKEVKDGDGSQSMMYVVDGVPVDADYVASIDPDKIKDTQIITDPSAAAVYGIKADGGVMVISLKSSMDDYVTTKDNDLEVAYDIDMPYSIPGNGKEQSIDLQTKETTADYKYYCAPKLDSETYLLAEISDWERLGLLTGKANITYDGTYVGETQIDARSTQKKLALTLGTDKRVSIKREKLNDYSSTRFLGSDTKQVFTYKLTVRNNQSKSIKLVLKDQYPRSTQKNIEVELLTKETTPWTANIESLGVITWEEELKAGEVKEYKISYSVKYPKDANLNL